MTYLFRGTFEQIVEGFHENLDRAREPAPYAEKAFLDAMVGLVRIYDWRARTPPADHAGLDRFRRESAAKLATYARDIAGYVQEATWLAEAADDDWYELCVRRSAIQSLLDDYAETPAVAAIGRDDLAALDAELRRVGAEQGPVPDEFIPKGMPETHWWWRYPRSA
jgi:hypothetical protein